ncbi:MAG: AMP-binding protein [Pseudonocardiaceae bacterium]|nr:AMP-binding protein [Pseudonocardiaceae bacterium]
MDLGIITHQWMQRGRLEGADRPAMSFEDKETWTYRELHERVNKYANALLDLGAQRGDRVAILMYNSIHYWALYLAIARAGCIAVRLNWRLTGEELAFALKDSGTTILCMHDVFADTILPVLGETDVEEMVGFDYEGPALPDRVHGQQRFESADPSEPPVQRPAADDTCMLMYTSGTTGRPKGALWTHGNTLWFGALQGLHWKYDHTTTAFSVGPQYHVGAFEDHALPALMAGGHVVVFKSGNYQVERLVEIIEKQRVTDALIYPNMLYDLLSSPRVNEFDLSSIRTITCGGMAILPWALRKLREDFPQVNLEQVYGLTEGGAMTTTMPIEYTDKHPNSVGKPLPFNEVRIARRDDERTDAAPDEIGEVWVRSPGLLGVYYNRPEATAETFVDGWCKTGDLGRMTEDGFLYITGRAKDMIISGGENIYPVELETILTDHPEIKDAAVIGVPDAKYQETVCAVIVCNNDATVTEDDIIEYSRSRLAGYKRPRYVVFLDELPRTPSGKVLKRVLRDDYEGLGTRRPEEATEPQ